MALVLTDSACLGVVRGVSSEALAERVCATSSARLPDSNSCFISMYMAATEPTNRAVFAAVRHGSELSLDDIARCASRCETLNDN